MAKQASEPTTRELRQLFGRLYDQAAGLAESLRPCRCDRSAPAEDSQDLNAMVQELLPVRQRVGGCICGPPCDGTSVDNVSNEFLEEMLARLQWDLNVLDENLVPCDCDAKPEVAEKTPEPVVDQTTVPVVQQNPSPLLRLPLEIRNMIWWRVLEPPRPVDRNWPRWYVRVVHRNLKPGENTVGHWFHRPRFSIDRLVTSNGRYRTTFQRHREQYQWSDRPGRWALLFVNRQVYEEAEDQFWRRTFGDGLMLSFRPDDIDVAEHYGILAAWTFFNHYRGLYLDQIRRLQLNLALPATRDPEGRDLWGQALQTTWSFGTSNGADFLVPLLDIMAGELPNLEHLSLTFGGWVPDMREEPWAEGPPDPATPPQSSVPWVTRLLSIRGLTRLRLRVIFTTEAAQETPRDILVRDDNPVTGDGIQRSRHFLSTLRGSMLVNGEALGDSDIRHYVTNRLGGARFLIVECDDSWNEDTEEHTAHQEDERDWGWNNGEAKNWDRGD